MKICKRFFCALWALLLCLYLFPLDIQTQAAKYSDNIQWFYQDGVLTLKGTGHVSGTTPNFPWDKYSSQITEIVIQPGITGLGGVFFEGCSKLTRVTLPEGLEEIGRSCFSGCVNLTDIRLPDSLKRIGRGCFSGCVNLADIRFPDSLKHIEQDAFRDCARLESITIPTSLRKIDSEAFVGCSNLKAVHIPDMQTWLSITFQDAGANPLSTGAELLLNGQPVTDVVLPASIQEVGQYAFYNCKSLRSVMIPDGVTLISPKAFGACVNLESVSLPNSLQLVGSDAFEGCHSLENVTYRGSLRQVSKLRVYIERDDPLFQANWMLTKPHISMTMAKAFSNAGKQLLIYAGQVLVAGAVLFLAKKARKPSYF